MLSFFKLEININFVKHFIGIIIYLLTTNNVYTNSFVL